MSYDLYTTVAGYYAHEVGIKGRGGSLDHYWSDTLNAWGHNYFEQHKNNGDMGNPRLATNLRNPAALCFLYKMKSPNTIRVLCTTDHYENEGSSYIISVGINMMDQANKICQIGPENYDFLGIGTPNKHGNEGSFIIRANLINYELRSPRIVKNLFQDLTYDTLTLPDMQCRYNGTGFLTVSTVVQISGRERIYMTEAQLSYDWK